MHVLKSKSCNYFTHNISTLNRKEDLIFIEKKEAIGRILTKVHTNQH